MARTISANNLIEASKFMPLFALRSLTSRRGLGVYASSDTMFKGAVFGRDSLEVCEDLLNTRRLLVKKSLLTLASLQGEINDTRNEEEPGKIIHEYRTRIVDGKQIRGKQLAIFEKLSSLWGGNQDEMVYYGSVDATPQFVRVVGRYCKRYGPGLLEQQVTLRSGNHLPLAIIVENAMTWLLRHLDQSQSGLVEYHRVNPHGIENQVWKDSDEFYVHETGELANHNGPIASIEVQGLAYDALLTASYLLPIYDQRYRTAARKLRKRTIELLWQPDRQYFALGTDFDPRTNALRVIHTKTANPAALLDTFFFDDLPAPDRQKYVSCIIRHIMSADFITNAGVRSRALSEASLISFWDYHGSYVSWPKETYDIAKGLRRQDFPELARELENRILNVCLRNLAYPEFVYVDARGRVLSARPSTHSHGEITMVDSPNKPETVQAWTVSAAIAILAQRAKAKLLPISVITGPKNDSWEVALERQLLEDIPRVRRLFNIRALKRQYPTHDYRLEQTER